MLALNCEISVCGYHACEKRSRRECLEADRCARHNSRQPSLKKYPSAKPCCSTTRDPPNRKGGSLTRNTFLNPIICPILHPVLNLSLPCRTRSQLRMHRNATPAGRNLASLPFARLHERPTADKDHGSASSEAFSSPVHLSPPSSRQNSRTSSPFTLIQPAGPANAAGQGAVGGPNKVEERLPDPQSFDNGEEGFDEWNNENWDEGEDDDDMPSDLRPSLDRHNKGRSSQPLLSSKDHPGYDSPPRPRPISRHSRLHERDPDLEARNATKRRYMLASIFLVLSLITFTVQTETAVYITKRLHWEKSYCML